MSESTSNLEISLLSSTRLDSNPTITKNDNNSTRDNNNARQLDHKKSIDTMIVSVNEQEENAKNSKTKIRRNSSLISFKSLDMSLKSILSFKGHKSNSDKCRNDSISTQKTNCILRAPYLKVETVSDESQKLLLTYAQSPQHRRSFDTSSQYLSTQTNYQELAQSPHSSSPYLSVSTGNIRRSSTSDILGGGSGGGVGGSCSRKGSAHQSSCGSVLESRKPSTSDLLRKARERKGSEGKIGRSMSHGGISRGMRNRRTSMAY